MPDNKPVETENTNKHVLEPGISAIIKIVKPGSDDKENDNNDK